jgi:predicted DNA-binding transcriptional regulator YafY
MIHCAVAANRPSIDCHRDSARAFRLSRLVDPRMLRTPFRSLSSRSEAPARVHNYALFNQVPAIPRSRADKLVRSCQYLEGFALQMAPCC